VPFQCSYQIWFVLGANDLAATILVGLIAGSPSQWASKLCGSIYVQISETSSRIDDTYAILFAILGALQRHHIVSVKNVITVNV